MSLLRVFHSVATGSRRKRELLTPLGLLIFGLSLAAVIVLGLFTDRLLSMPELMPGSIGFSIGDMSRISGGATRTFLSGRYILDGQVLPRLDGARHPGQPVPVDLR